MAKKVQYKHLVLEERQFTENIWTGACLRIAMLLPTDFLRFPANKRSFFVVGVNHVT